MSANSRNRVTRFGSSFIHRAPVVVAFFFAFAFVSTFAHAAASQEELDALKKHQTHAEELYAQRKFVQAEPELRAVLAIEQRVLGEGHPDTLKTQSNLAMALQYQRKFAQAEAEYRAVIAIRERVLGPEHPDTLAARIGLTTPLCYQNKRVEAAEECRTVTAIRERVLGPGHPDTLRSRKLLVHILWGQRQLGGATKEFRAILAVQERVLGANHPDVFETCDNLSHCLASEDMREEAIPFARRAHEGYRAVFGVFDSHTKLSNAYLKHLEGKSRFSSGPVDLGGAMLDGVYDYLTDEVAVAYLAIAALVLIAVWLCFVLKRRFKKR